MLLASASMMPPSNVSCCPGRTSKDRTGATAVFHNKSPRRVSLQVNHKLRYHYARLLLFPYAFIPLVVLFFLMSDDLYVRRTSVAVAASQELRATVNTQEGDSATLGPTTSRRRQPPPSTVDILANLRKNRKLAATSLMALAAAGAVVVTLLTMRQHTTRRRVKLLRAARRAPLSNSPRDEADAGNGFRNQHMETTQRVETGHNMGLELFEQGTVPVLKLRSDDVSFRNQKTDAEVLGPTYQSSDAK
ncbi:putative transmembrane protein [Toxoplasma gondii VAND]|uniref:Putative transmembrane protein n=3 Tax=Toxoplasma gondii TaxID=5811 RepID=A0A086PKC7_TOXGO|nr:putative transmembrane protein [Toxoplasma gondii VAND]KFH00809.1 putative transmembrane protein [Toxoplasma gondii MAS]PUA83367.1 putative transmembrane protein [Toxoplasma gondii TgCATBr9]